MLNRLLILFIIVSFSGCQQSANKNPIVGNTYSFSYSAVDPKDAKQKSVSEYMNYKAFTGHFLNDSTLLVKSLNDITKEKWFINLDSVNIGGVSYLLTNTGQSLLLLSKNERLELTPIF